MCGCGSLVPRTPTRRMRPLCEFLEFNSVRIRISKLREADASEAIQECVDT